LGVDTKQHSLYSDAMHLTSTKFSSGLKNQFPTVTPLSWSNIWSKCHTLENPHQRKQCK